MPCYIHSFAMTSKYIIIIEQPLFIDKTATNGINLHHHLKWKAHLPVSYLIPISLGVVRKLRFHFRLVVTGSTKVKCIK